MLKPTLTLPEGYLPVATIDLSKDWRALVAVNVLALALLFVFSALFYQTLIWIRPSDYALGLVVQAGSTLEMLELVGILLILLAVMVIIHEVLHGICFWGFTRVRPRFAFKGAYAYAALPDWFLPRGQYLLTALAPFFGITLIGLVLLAIAPPAWFLSILVVMVFNASGAAGDLVVAGWLLFLPSNTYVQDRGDAVSFYKPHE
ncbi:MAG TPA: DUF3267 domain-containing protein [Longilinea sp.]|nr:DUF3267 domain-containing protein [Longilinea sp.]